jgi:cytochrome c-type biogenesis protein CcsB
VSVAVDTGLAQTSDLLVHTAMAVYTGALLAFAADLSGLGRAARRAPEAAAVPVGVAAGRAGSLDEAAADPTAAVPTARRRGAGIGMSLTVLAAVLHVGAVALRGVSASRVPWGNMYEFAVTGSAVVTGVFLALVLGSRTRDLRYLGTFVVGPVLLTLGLAVTALYTESARLVPALDSSWLVIHVSVAFVSSALFTIAFSATVLQIVQSRREAARAAGRAPRRGAFMDALPAARELERAAYRLIAVSFPLWTFTLVAGAIWAEVAWGRYWGWDPKEVWTFVIWVVYAAYLHARATRGWDGSRAAWLAVAGYACVLVNFGVVNVLFPGNHSYAGIG